MLSLWNKKPPYSHAFMYQTKRNHWAFLHPLLGSLLSLSSIHRSLQLHFDGMESEKQEIALKKSEFCGYWNGRCWDTAMLSDTAVAVAVCNSTTPQQKQAFWEFRARGGESNGVYDWFSVFSTGWLHSVTTQTCFWEAAHVLRIFQTSSSLMPSSVHSSSTLILVEVDFYVDL